MKKAYSKPEIMFEDFTLTNSITVGCAALVGAPTAGQCAYEVVTSKGSKYIFTTGMTEICTSPESDDEYNGLCYHVFSPEATGALFNS